MLPHGDAAKTAPGFDPGPENSDLSVAPLHAPCDPHTFAAAAKVCHPPAFYRYRDRKRATPTRVRVVYPRRRGNQRWGGGLSAKPARPKVCARPLWKARSRGDPRAAQPGPARDGAAVVQPQKSVKSVDCPIPGPRTPNPGPRPPAPEPGTRTPAPGTRNPEPGPRTPTAAPRAFGASCLPVCVRSNAIFSDSPCAPSTVRAPFRARFTRRRRGPQAPTARNITAWVGGRRPQAQVRYGALFFIHSARHRCAIRAPTVRTNATDDCSLFAVHRSARPAADPPGKKTMGEKWGLDRTICFDVRGHEPAKAARGKRTKTVECPERLPQKCFIALRVPFLCQLS
jgi:hypothetical protein